MRFPGDDESVHHLRRWHENWIGEMLMLIENVGLGEDGNGQGLMWGLDFLHLLCANGDGYFPVTLHHAWNCLLGLKTPYCFPVQCHALGSIASAHPGAEFVQHHLKGLPSIVKCEAAPRILGIVLLKESSSEAILLIMFKGKTSPPPEYGICIMPWTIAINQFFKMPEPF